MMLSQKVLDGLFKALDLAEELRTAVQRLRGKPTEPAPWEHLGDSAPVPTPPLLPEQPAPEALEAPKQPRKRAKKSVPPPAAERDLAGFIKRVDKKVLPPPAEDLAVDGKPVLARIVWALAHAQAQLGRGLTGAELAQVLGKAGFKTLANNVLRAVRQDGGTHVERGPRQGNASLLVLTAAGRKVARDQLGVSLK